MQLAPAQQRRLHSSASVEEAWPLPPPQRRNTPGALWDLPLRQKAAASLLDDHPVAVIQQACTRGSEGVCERDGGQGSRRVQRRRWRRRRRVRRRPAQASAPVGVMTPVEREMPRAPFSGYTCRELSSMVLWGFALSRVQDAAILRGLPRSGTEALTADEPREPAVMAAAPCAPAAAATWGSTEAGPAPGHASHLAGLPTKPPRLVSMLQVVARACVPTCPGSSPRPAAPAPGGPAGRAGGQAGAAEGGELPRGADEGFAFHSKLPHARALPHACLWRCAALRASNTHLRHGLGLVHRLHRLPPPLAELAAQADEGDGGAVGAKVRRKVEVQAVHAVELGGAGGWEEEEGEARRARRRA